MLWLTDAQETMCTFESDPEYVREFLRIIDDWQMKMLDLALDAGADQVTRFGYYDTPDFWGRTYFSEFLRPLMEREAKMCEHAGATLCQQQSEGKSA